MKKNGDGAHGNGDGPGSAGKKTVGELVPQAHGGALWKGTPATTVGWGRPANVIREQFRESFAGRLNVLEQIADGEVVRKTRVPLTSVLRHAHCPSCEEKGLAYNDPAAAAFVDVEATVSATPRERTEAIKVMGQFGLGTMKQLSRDDVSGRLVETIRIVKATLSEEQAKDLLARIAPVWR